MANELPEAAEAAEAVEAAEAAEAAEVAAAEVAAAVGHGDIAASADAIGRRACPEFHAAERRC